MRHSTPLRPAILALCAAALAAPVMAQDDVPGTARPKDRRDSTHLMSAEDIEVLSNDGTKIGEVEEILVDPDGRPAGVLIEFDGFHLFEDDDVAVPMEALAFDGQAYVSKMTEDQLANLQRWVE